MLNVVILQGRFTKDPELRRTTGGKEVVNAVLAVRRNYGDETDFINITAWGSTAQFIEKYFKKGRMIVVQGELETRKYETREGKTNTVYEVAVRQVHFAGDKADEDEV